MIALDRDIPKNCMDCPCMHTIIVQDVASRFCMAEHKNILLIPKDQTIAPHWMQFQKPEWCPWEIIARIS